MYKRLGVVALVLALALMIAVPAAMARGPAPRATGSVWLDPTSHDDGGYVRYLEFDAHGPRGNRPIKGHLYWYQSREGHTFEHRINIDDARFEGELTPLLIPIPEGCAFFSGIAYDGPNSGLRLCIFACDVGTPGAAGDWLMALWSKPDTGEFVGDLWRYDVVSGNLVVHTYD